MQLVIDILEREYETIRSAVKKGYMNGFGGEPIYRAIAEGKPLPKGHGRLIDADKVLKDTEDLQKSPWYNDERFMKMQYLIHEGVETVRDLCIKKAPTIIEADEEEKV